MLAFQPGNHICAKLPCSLDQIVGVFLAHNANPLVHDSSALARAYRQENHPFLMLLPERVLQGIDRKKMVAWLPSFRLVSFGVKCDRAQFERGIVCERESSIGTEVLARVAQVAINDFEQLLDLGDRRLMRVE